MTTITSEPPVRLFASAHSWIEAKALRQLHATAGLEGARATVGFPNLHPGQGIPVGTALVTEGVIHPCLIGPDPGCGTAWFQTDLLLGKARLEEWSAHPFDLEHPWEGDARARLAERGLLATQFVKSFGTLGGGNHFVELQAVETVIDREAFKALHLVTDKLMLLVHSGSRDFGEAVLEAHLEEHGAASIEAPSHAATRYLLCHDLAMRWAQGNRALLAERFLAAIGGTGRRLWDAAHNSITAVPPGRAGRGGANFWLHRKGAAPADCGPLVIPGSRGTFSYLVEPCGDGAENAWSLPHGAGRKWSRSESRLRMRERFRPAQLTWTGLGSRVVCGDRALLYEEAPEAYKSIDRVIADMADAGLIAVIAILRPLLTYKSRE